MRTKAKQPTWLACAVILMACGDEGGNAADASSSSTGDEVAESSSADDTSSEGGPVATGVCVGWSTANAKSDVFIPADGASSDACAQTVAACGGDPHGTWTLDASCGYDLTPLANPLAQSCPGGSFTAMTPTRSGTLSVDEAGHFTLHVATMHGFTFEADVECFGTFNCDASVADALTQDGGTATCSGGPTDCTCNVTNIERDASTAEGELRGADALVFASPGPSAHPFCVADGRLEVWTLPGTAMVTSTACEVDSECSDVAAGTIGACLPG